jgi:hypothetical protein
MQHRIDGSTVGVGIGFWRETFWPSDWPSDKAHVGSLFAFVIEGEPMNKKIIKITIIIYQSSSIMIHIVSIIDSFFLFIIIL